MHEPGFLPLAFQAVPVPEMLARVRAFETLMRCRRTVRDFSDEPVPREVIESAIRIAGSAPSGANQQPWTFVAVADPAVKARIRVAAEQEERAFYDGRAGEEWLEVLKVLGTGWTKPFLKTAPWLIVVFQQRWGIRPDGAREKHYYAPESVGIAAGFLIAALHHAGLATLTHTPAPMGFLNEICGRPENEKPMILLASASLRRTAEYRQSGRSRSTRLRPSFEAGHLQARWRAAGGRWRQGDHLGNLFQRKPCCPG